MLLTIVHWVIMCSLLAGVSILSITSCIESFEMVDKGWINKRPVEIAKNIGIGLFLSAIGLIIIMLIALYLIV